MASRGVFGRADLLQALVLRPGLAVLGLPESAQAESLAYLRKEPSPPVLEMPAVVHVEPVAATAPARPTLRPPLRMPWGWQAERVLHAPDEGHGDEGEVPDADGSAVPVPVVPLVRATEDEALALQDAVDAPLPQQRLRDALRVALGEVAARRGRVDWPGVVRHLAQGRRLSRLLRVAPPAWPGHLHVVLDDKAESMRSLAWDMAVWRRRLGQVMGDSRLVVHRLGHTLEALERPGAPGFDSVGQRWLILGDGRVTEPEQQRRFDAWTRGLRHRQHAVALRAPMPVGVVDVAGVAEALALLAMLGQVSTLLLRALCQGIPGAAAGLEWAMWNHPQVRRAGHHVELRPECLDAHVRHLQTLPPERLQQALARQRTFQRSLPEADLHLVPLRAARLAPSLAEALAGEVEAARAFFADMVREGGRLQGRARLDWALRAARLVDKAPDVVRVADRATFEALARQVCRAGEDARGEAVPWWLKLGPEGMRLDQVPDRPGAGLLQHPVGPLVPGESVKVIQQGLTRWIGPLRDGITVGTLPENPLEVGWAMETVWVTRRERPRWAEGFEQGAQGLMARFRWPDGSPATFQLGMPWQQRMPWGGASFELQCDEYGLSLSWTFEVEGRKDRMRFRHIPPGTFLMGSPAGIGADNEYPQHPVTLTEGFWLADAPCTQAQWQAVMDNNPSHFRAGPDAPRRPVEQVRGDDVQQFLQRLQAMLPPGCEPALPTEAQWEYAARAGTTTAYWWGDEPDGQRANMDIDNSKDWDGENGTSPVDRYPPNPWGLHDMHGNVWEWCADDQRPYADRAERDPTGSTGGDARVVRGGSWISHSGVARSAFRGGGHRVRRYLYRGFRVLLRSSSPGPGGPDQPSNLRGGTPGGRDPGEGRSSKRSRRAKK